MKRLVLAVALALIVGTFLGSRFLAVPLRTFSVDREGNQHCSGLRHGEHFEVFCLSVERPWGESASRDLDEWAGGASAPVPPRFAPQSRPRPPTWRRQ